MGLDGWALSTVIHLTLDNKEALKKADLPNHPEVFVEKILGTELWSKQEDVLESAFKYRQTYVQSGNSVGKTYIAAITALTFLFCYSPLYGYEGGTIVAVLGAKVESLRKQFFAEVRNAYKHAKFPLGGELLAKELRIGDKRWISIFGAKKENVEKIQGYHAQNVLGIVEEASGIESEILEALEGCATTVNSHILCIGNPIRTDGVFYERCTDPNNEDLKEKGLRNTLKISSLEVPNVVEGKEIYPGLATKEWIEEHRLKWGEETPSYQSRILGEFPANSESSLIPLAAFEEACRKGDEHEIREDDDERVLAMDIARQGDDESVIISLAGDVISKVWGKRTPDTMLASDWFLGMYREFGGIPAIDENGLGGGPYDYLRNKKHLPIRGFISQRKSSQPERFANLKAEMGWSLRERFIEGMISIPNTRYRDRLRRDLTGYRVEPDNKGRTKIIDPANSPDYGDALIIAHWAQTANHYHFNPVTGGTSLSKSLTDREY